MVDSDFIGHHLGTRFKVSQNSQVGYNPHFEAIA